MFKKNEKIIQFCAGNFPHYLFTPFYLLTCRSGGGKRPTKWSALEAERTMWGAKTPFIGIKKDCLL
jgi:hypothetical protein